MIDGDDEPIITCEDILPSSILGWFNAGTDTLVSDVSKSVVKGFHTRRMNFNPKLFGYRLDLIAARVTVLEPPNAH